MRITFGSNFTLSKPIDGKETRERFPLFRTSYKAIVAPGLDAYDTFMSIRDENDWKVEEFLKEKGISFTKESSLEHFKKRWMSSRWGAKDETTATQEAQSDIDQYAQYIETPGIAFHNALIDNKPSEALRLLQAYPIKLSYSDDPDSNNIPERLLGNDENFEALSLKLGSNAHAKSFIKKMLASEIQTDLESGAQNWKGNKRWSHRNLVNEALKLAEQTIASYKR